MGAELQTDAVDGRRGHCRILEVFDRCGARQLDGATRAERLQHVVCHAVQGARRLHAALGRVEEFVQRRARNG
eukprot:scaffold92579_cov30-Phaeocystis_antarctica.AAC.1